MDQIYVYIYLYIYIYIERETERESQTVQVMEIPPFRSCISYWEKMGFSGIEFDFAQPKNI